MFLIRSKVPLRISFCGGGTDVSPYCDDYGGVVLNTTIDRYATVNLKPNDTSSIEVQSIDYDESVRYDIDDFLAYDGHLDLIKGVIRYFKSNYSFPSGFKLSIQNDAPPGSGLGSSSAVCVALVGAFRQWLKLPLSLYEVAELAYHIEREELAIRGGRQDQYAAAFGGLNFMEFCDGRTVVNPLRLRNETNYELHHSLLLVYVGGSHDSSRILKRQIDDMSSPASSAVASLHRIRELTFEMKNYLLMGKLGKFGQRLDNVWRAKREITEGITNSRIDVIYETARRAGALGGKISGAGGGGYMFLFVDIDRRSDVIKAMGREGAQIANYSFTEEGLHTWEVR